MKAYQIYFKEEQKSILDYEPYMNKVCTPFFENSVIRDKRDEMSDHEYFAVLSWKLREKITISKTSWRRHPNIANTSNRQFEPDLFNSLLYKHKPDVFSFQCHMGHDPITFGERFHPGLIKHFKYIMSEIGLQWSPTRFNHVFYCNFFTAKGEIYQKYVDEMLAPAMDVMDQMPELMLDSNYPDKGVFTWGIHYPWHTFICERMFSYFAHIHKLKAIHF